MEPISHLEWTLGISLIVLGTLGEPLGGLELLILGVGSVFPDLFDLLLSSGNRFSKVHREFSHTVYFVSGLLLISIPFRLPRFLLLGSILHILEDILAGRTPVYLFSPITHRGGICVVSKEQSIKIGGWVRDILKGAYIGSENIGDELSWFWLQTIIGTWILILGILVYFG
ncbi:MAG: metal-dependent hydrolase [Candidatus Heimdallarchaeota archaeon]